MKDEGRKPVRYAFFGSSRFSVFVLEELEKAGYPPACVVTTPDKPKGRHLDLTPTPVKEWALARGVKLFEPARLDEPFSEALKAERCDAFIVASYGKIIPAHVIGIPPRKTLNVHPSLLPELRGASPLQATILSDQKETGVTIMRIDEQVDHGPIVAQEKVSIAEWPPYEEFEEAMARAGGKLLARILPDWIAGKIEEKEQDHSAATFTKKVVKEDGLIDLAGDQRQNFLKIQAYSEWPQAYFVAERDGAPIRVKVTRASWKGGELVIEKVVPEGRREMDYKDFNSNPKTRP